MRESEKKIDHLTARLEAVVRAIERSGLEDLMVYRRDFKKTLWHTFWMGIVRGIGTAIGVTILGAVVLYILQKIAVAHLPVIGDALAEIMKIVESKM